MRPSIGLLSFALLSLVAIRVPVSAQLVLIPDVNLRTWFNAQVPGCVDEAGFLDTTLPELQEVDTAILYITWEPFDLTGLEELANLNYLDVQGNGNGGVINALPADLSWLRILNVPSTPLPTLPASLRYLDLIQLSLTELPPLPSQLESLGLGSVQIEVIGPFPESLTELRLAAIWPELTEITSFPIGLREFFVAGTAPDVNVDCLPVLPDGLERFWLDIIFGAAFQCVPNIPANPAFEFVGGPIPPLCESGVHSCALTTSVARPTRAAVLVAPVPAQEELYVQNSDAQPRSVRIVDAVGAVMYHGRTDGPLTVITVGAWSSGAYALILDEGAEIHRFIKE